MASHEKLTGTRVIPCALERDSKKKIGVNNRLIFSPFQEHPGHALQLQQQQQTRNARKSTVSPDDPAGETHYLYTLSIPIRVHNSSVFILVWDTKQTSNTVWALQTSPFAITSARVVGGVIQGCTLPHFLVVADR